MTEAWASWLGQVQWAALQQGAAHCRDGISMPCIILAVNVPCMLPSVPTAPTPDPQPPAAPASLAGHGLGAREVSEG